MDDARSPLLPGLAAITQPYLSWRQSQANNSALADMILPQMLPDFFNRMAYGDLPKEPPFTSVDSTMTYLPAAAGLMALFGMNGYGKSVYDTAKGLYPNMVLRSAERMLFDGKENAK